ncbi:MAG: pirin family protein [Acidobacteriaceae bacterium]|nr:pirin family protein [Acidobacteriaceae bacterium]
MITLRKSNERGHANHGWLDSHHTFSFASYYDPEHMGFRSLRVINEDRVAPGRGFGAHGHRDMEILTYVLSGSLAHKDSMGHQEVLGPNEIQRMSAGTGIIHSEFNASETEPVHFFQIWIEPSTTGTQSTYEQIGFRAEEKNGKLKLLAGPRGGNGVARINQDAQVFVAEVPKGEKIGYDLKAQRHSWLHVIRGAVNLNGTPLHTGDAAAVSDETGLTITGTDSEPSEILLFDLA